MKIIKSEQAKLAVEIGRKNRKTFRPLEGRGVLTEPVYREEWWYIPIEQDKSVIPQEALYRAELLQNAGIKMKGMIVAHEAPLALLAPKEEREIRRQKAEVLTGLIALAGIAVLVLGWIVSIPAAAAVAIGAPSGMAFSWATAILATSALVDPALIVVLEDGTWVEVCAWDESFG